MVHTGFALLTIYLPVVLGLSSSQIHRKTHVSGTVRLLGASETVHPSGSDILFNWEQCILCDGYDARLHLEDVAGKREIPYQLKSTVTALKVSNLAPRSAYRLVVKTISSEAPGSEVSGRTSSPAAPPPVENLVARALSSSEIEIDWDSNYASGFFAEIISNGSVIQEKTIAEFSNHTAVKIEGLEPDSVYQIRVSAFFSPRSETSASTVSLVQVKTLPAVLPTLKLSWELKNEQVRLFWKNPESPKPVTYQLMCTQGSRTIFEADFSGLTDSVALPGIARDEAIQCKLHTRFSTNRRIGVETDVSIPKEEKRTSGSSFEEFFRECGPYQVQYSANFELERKDGTEWPLVRFSESHLGLLSFEEVQYRLCEVEKPQCETEWISVPSAEYPELFLKSRALKPWQRYFIEYSFDFRCHYQRSRKLWTTTRSLELPQVIGPVDPVTEFVATKSGVEWEYGNSLIAPDYFLLTICAKSKCMSQSASGADRSATLGNLNGSLVYDIAIQAVVLRHGRTYASPTKMTSYVAPNFNLAENIALKYEETPDSATVKLLITHNSSADVPQAVEYHIAACSRPVLIWKEQELEQGANIPCESFVTKNSSVDVVRKPWTTYDVSVFACYGTFDSNDPVNLTLPVFKRKPGAVAALELLWDQGKLLKWNYGSWMPSGFFVSACRSSIGSAHSCKIAETGPTTRSYQVDQSLLDGEVTLSVTPFVFYGGNTYNGTEAKMTVVADPTESSDER